MNRIGRRKFIRNSTALVFGAAGISRAEERYREFLRDINQAVVFTIANRTTSDYELDLARQASSDVLIRGWFKWGTTKPSRELQPLPGKAHAFGALFGGGVTCSAVYDTENGITREQLLDMATRGADGELVDAWGRPGVRHGSLSSPAYLDYLFRWCREQIDLGADYLFMDEHNAALSAKEGFDDHSLADFRSYLRTECPDCTFDSRESLRAQGNNALLPYWRRFRTWRDDRAWKSLTDRIRVYAKQHNREVLISANGLAKYVDLQVLGIWTKWAAKDGHIDVSENLLPYWQTLVEKGRALAGRRVPVVLFHDWGQGNPPFKWLSVSQSEREVWMRTRGAEIYAAGAFFAFPVIGPFGCDSGKDGTISVMAEQAAFYKANRDLYLNAEFLGANTVQSATPDLSLAVWSKPDSHAVIVHVVNRNVVNGVLKPRRDVVATLPLDRVPTQASVISPDFRGERPVRCRIADGRLNLELGELNAYSVAILRYQEEIGLGRLHDQFISATSPK